VTGLRRFAGERGQAMVEFALVLPILLLLVMGVAELTQAYSDALTIGAASREGVRVAGALVNGGGALGCSAGQSPNASTVDPQIIAAVERVLTASGTSLALGDVSEIRIYKATTTGSEVSGSVNQFTYQLNGGPIVDGQQTDFIAQTNGWPACQRSNATPADSAGVAIRYTYRGRTPLRFLVPFLATIPIRDNTVMSLNATR
jgi:Flp pilus assembly protein TadG